METTINYKGTVYQVPEFTDDHPHIEPCGECCFGRSCRKPRDFERCTGPLRKDGRNVYFTCFGKGAKV